MNRMSNYISFNELRNKIKDLHENIDIDIMVDIDYLTVDIEGITKIDLDKKLDVLVHNSDQFRMNDASYTRSVQRIAEFVDDKIESTVELTNRNMLAFNDIIDSYNKNGLFYRIVVCNKYNLLDDEEYKSFDTESEKIIPILESCVKAMVNNGIIFNGVFVGYLSGSKPKWIPEEWLTRYGFIGIDDPHQIRNIQLYFQDNKVPKI